MRQLLTNCTVVPCDGRPPIEDAQIIVDGNRIEAIDRRTALSPLVDEAGAELHVRDMRGRWIMPV